MKCLMAAGAADGWTAIKWILSEKSGLMSYLMALRMSSSGKSVSSLAANSQRYSWRNQRSPMTRRSRARLAGRMRGQSVAGTLMRCQDRGSHRPRPGRKNRGGRREWR